MLEPAVRRAPGAERGRGVVAGIDVDEHGAARVQRDGQFERKPESVCANPDRTTTYLHDGGCVYHMVCPKVVNRITRWVYDRNGVIGRLGRSMIDRLSRRLDRLPARTDTPGATPPRRVGGAPDSDQEGNSNHRREGARSRSGRRRRLRSCDRASWWASGFYPIGKSRPARRVRARVFSVPAPPVSSMLKSP